MKSKFILGSRIVLGLIFLIFGLNFFFHFIAVPPPPEAGGKFLGALFETGYIFPIIKVLEVVLGAALIAGIFVPLSLVLLAPIVVNIFLYHTILAPEGAALAIVILILEIVLLVANKAKFDPLLKMK